MFLSPGFSAPVFAVPPEEVEEEREVFVVSAPVFVPEEVEEVFVVEMVKKMTS
jgi:hypothetical protein